MRRFRTALGASVAAIATFGRSIVPVGVFAVLVVGVHAGTDRVDDYTFGVLNGLDIIVDSAAAAVVETLLGWSGASAERIARVTFAIQDFVDLDTKHGLSRILALVLEIVSDVALAVPLFLHRARAYSFQSIWIQITMDPTILRVAGPLAVFFAGLAGTLAVAREVQVGVHGWLIQYERLMGEAETVATTTAVMAVVLVAWRLGVVALRRAISLAESRAQRDDRMMTPVSKRRLRGLFVAVVVLPVTLLAVVEAVPPWWPVLRGLFEG